MAGGVIVSACGEYTEETGFAQPLTERVRKKRSKVFGGDRKGLAEEDAGKKGVRSVARTVLSLPVELYLYGVTSPINREHYSPVDSLRIRWRP